MIIGNPLEGLSLQEPTTVYHAEPGPNNTLVYRDDPNGIWLYQGNSLSLMDRIAEKHPDGCFDCIFADPPYFLSNGGITCYRHNCFPTRGTKMKKAVDGTPAAVPNPS